MVIITKSILPCCRGTGWEEENDSVKNSSNKSESSNSGCWQTFIYRCSGIWSLIPIIMPPAVPHVQGRMGDFGTRDHQIPIAPYLPVHRSLESTGKLKAGCQQSGDSHLALGTNWGRFKDQDCTGAWTGLVQSLPAKDQGIVSRIGTTPGLL